MTERVREALNDAFSRALRERNPSVEPEHILAALLAQDGGVAGALVAKAGSDVAALERNLDAALGKLPRMTAGTSSRSFRRVRAACSCRPATKPRN
jgi:ATP-dependent Clp protease ATP-binding subunit ClpB